jgi:hypothetical protein
VQIQLTFCARKHVFQHSTSEIHFGLGERGSTPRSPSARGARSSACDPPWVALAIAVQRNGRELRDAGCVRCWIEITFRLEMRRGRRTSVGFIRGIIQHVGTRRLVIFLRSSSRSASPRITRSLDPKLLPALRAVRLHCVEEIRNEDGGIRPETTNSRASTEVGQPHLVFTPNVPRAAGTPPPSAVDSR